jgi:hypothetical protein
MESGGWKKFMENPIIQINNPFDLKNKEKSLLIFIWENSSNLYKQPNNVIDFCCF